MMQKDEHLLLGPWLSYYGALFGFENLFVLDNGSVRADVRTTLAEFERHGVHVDRDHSGREHYRRKGEVVGDSLLTLQAFGSYDFLLPLDCDEFLALRTNGRFSFAPPDIDQYLESLLGEARVLRVPFQLANHPVQPDIYHHFAFHKVFFTGGSFVSVDHGNHVGVSAHEPGHVDTDLVYFHIHYKRYDVHQQQARRSWIGSVSADDRRALASYRGDSVHLAEYLIKDSTEFYSDFLKKVHFFVPELRATLSALGAPLRLPAEELPSEQVIRLTALDPNAAPPDTGVVALVPQEAADGTVQFVATTFSEPAYLAANPDLLAAGVLAMPHFCSEGFREGRPLQRAGVVKDAGCGSADLREPLWAIFRRYRESRQAVSVGAVTSLCLELGAGGDRARAGWLTTDLNAGAHAAELDAAKPFPLPSRSFDFVFSEHMIEHIPFDKGQLMLRQCFRVLKRGGVLRLATPALSFLLHLFSQDRSEREDRYIRWAVASFVPSAPEPLPSFVINNFMRAWGHQFIYDRPTLRHALGAAGFRHIVECEIGQSEHPELRGLESTERLPERFLELETMIFEATKEG